MKKIILLLMFIPLMSFGQNKYSVYQKNDANNYTTAKPLNEASQMLGNLAKEIAAKREAEAKRLGYSSASAYALKLKRERKSYRKNKKLSKKNKKLSKKTKKLSNNYKKKRKEENLKEVKKQVNNNNNDFMTVNQAKERAKILKNMLDDGDITKENYNKFIKKYNKIINQKL
tara:strand:+ start:295 stop:810 length:516 start_codon:yes stop_codon:yes gene_type:complete